MTGSKSNLIIAGAIAAVEIVVACSAPSALQAQVPPEPSSTPEQTSAPTFCSSHNTIAQATAEGADENPVEANTTQPRPVIVLGDLPDSPYVVAVPGREDVTLEAVRQCVPDAFLTKSRLGSYIRAGAFPHRSDAEKLSRHLRSLKLDARVMYFP
jgi:hypothetical protein